MGFGFIVPEGLGMIMAWEGKIGECIWWMSGLARWHLPRSKASVMRNGSTFSDAMLFFMRMTFPSNQAKEPRLMHMLREGMQPGLPALALL